MAAGPWARALGAVLVTALAVLGAPSASSAAPPEPGTVTWAGDGFVNASELDANIPVEWEAGDLSATGASGSFVQGDATPAGCGPYALPATGSGYLNEPCANALEEGPFSFVVVWHNADGDSEPVEAPYVKDTIAPEGTVEIVDGDGFVNAAEATDNVPANSTLAEGSEAVSSSVWFEQGGSTPADCGPWSVPTTNAGLLQPNCTANLEEGEFSFKGTWTDAAGNTSDVAQATSVKDTVGPDAPEVTFPAPGAALNTVRFEGTSEPGSTVEVLVGDVSIGTATAPTGSWSLESSETFAEGAHSGVATATDAAGNLGGTSDEVSFTVDTTRPDSPRITTPRRSGPGPDHEPLYLNDGDVLFEGTAEPNSTVRLRDRERGAGPDLGSTTADGDGNWATTLSLLDAAYPMRAHAVDAAGNVSVRSPLVNIVVDTLAPEAGAVTLDTGGDGVINAQEAPTGMEVTWTKALSGAEDAVSATVWFEQAGETPAGCGRSTADLTSSARLEGACLGALTDGPFTFNAQWVDRAGNASSVATAAAVLDRLGPDASVEILDADGLITPDEQEFGVDVSWSVAETGPDAVVSLANVGADAPAECVLSGQARSDVATMSPECLAALGHGAVVATVTADDESGNTSTATDDASIRRHAGSFETVVKGASNNPETGHVDTVLNMKETNDGKDLQVRLDLDRYDDVFGEVLATVELRDQGGDPAGQYLKEEATLSPADLPEDRTFSFDVAKAEFAQGAIAVKVTVEDQFGLVSEVARSLKLDLSAPKTMWKTANGTEFHTFRLPLLSPISTVKFEGSTADPSAISGIEWVYLLAKDASGRTDATHPRMVKPQTPQTDWSTSWALPPGTWDVVVRTADTAGNIEEGPRLRVTVAGL